MFKLSRHTDSRSGTALNRVDENGKCRLTVEQREAHATRNRGDAALQTIAVTVGSDRTDRQRVYRHNMRGLRDWSTRARPVDSAKRWHLQLQRGTEATDVITQLLARKPTAPSRSEWFYRSRAGRLERRRCRLVRQNRSRLRIQAILGASRVPSSVLASKSVDGSDLLTLDVEGSDFSAMQGGV